MEREDIFVVAQKYSDGNWNKLAKAQEMFWWDEAQAEAWLATKEDWFRQSNAVFKLRINIESAEKL